MKNLFVILVMLSAISVNAQWEPDVRLTNNIASTYTSLNNAWCIAANGNVVHTVWFDLRDLNWEIYYKRSTDGGITWGADTRITNNAANSRYPSIACSGLNVHIVWEDDPDGNLEIYYKCSIDGGITWGADTRITNNAANSRYPSIAVSGSLVNVIWQDYRDLNLEIYYKRSTDVGMNWGADTRLTNNIGSSGFSSIAVSGTLVHVVWQDDRDGIPQTEIYYKRSTDGGINWGADTRLMNNPFNSEYPCIAASGSLVHVVWQDDRDDGGIYYKRSTNDGITWGGDTCLSNNTANSLNPSISVSGTFVHVVWMDNRDNGVFYEIYYKRSTDGGVTWGADTRLTNNHNNSRHPSIALSGTFVHVVWMDNRDDNFYEIYYKRNPTGNLVGIQNISTETPSSFSLGQNFPNPFNPVTKIKFAVPSVKQASLLVTLKVYDITGREIQTLVNESLNPGTYEATFDGSKLNSGVYFYKMTTQGFTETKRMMLIK